MFCRLLPRCWPMWCVGASWDTYPFRLVWAGWWVVAYDRSHAWYRRWPYIVVLWNDD